MLNKDQMKTNPFSTLFDALQSLNLFPMFFQSQITLDLQCLEEKPDHESSLIYLNQETF